MSLYRRRFRRSFSPARGGLRRSAQAANRPVKIALPRPVISHTHIGPGDHPRIRIGAQQRYITAIGHESWSRSADGQPETAVGQTRLLYAGTNRMTATRLRARSAGGNAMRAPGEAPALMALEMRHGRDGGEAWLDPIAFRIKNDTQVDPRSPSGHSRSASWSNACASGGALRLEPAQREAGFGPEAIG